MEGTKLTKDRVSPTNHLYATHLPDGVSDSLQSRPGLPSYPWYPWGPTHDSGSVTRAHDGDGSERVGRVQVGPSRVVAPEGPLVVVVPDVTVRAATGRGRVAPRPDTERTPTREGAPEGPRGGRDGDVLDTAAVGRREVRRDGRPLRACRTRRVSALEGGPTPTTLPTPSRRPRVVYLGTGPDRPLEPSSVSRFSSARSVGVVVLTNVPPKSLDPPITGNCDFSHPRQVHMERVESLSQWSWDKETRRGSRGRDVTQITVPPPTMTSDIGRSGARPPSTPGREHRVRPQGVTRRDRELTGRTHDSGGESVSDRPPARPSFFVNTESGPTGGEVRYRPRSKYIYFGDSVHVLTHRQYLGTMGRVCVSFSTPVPVVLFPLTPFVFSSSSTAKTGSCQGVSLGETRRSAKTLPLGECVQVPGHSCPLPGPARRRTAGVTSSRPRTFVGPE